MPISSMTGFARAQGPDRPEIAPNWTWTWEVKSVNGRGLEPRCKMPPGFDSLEMPARELAAKRFKRGNLNIVLTVLRGADGGAVRINEALLAQIAEAMRHWKDKVGAEPPRIDGILALRGVMEPAAENESDEAREAREAAILATLDKAFAALKEMRDREGRRLEIVLQESIGRIGALAAEAEGLAALRPEAVKERMRLQLSTLLDAKPPIPEERLAQELALLASKIDVKEEIDRLKAHVAAAREMIAGTERGKEASGPVGRRLDFLCQEFTREANTLCSKAVDIELTRIGLELKATIEQFREQVQNIE